MKSCSAPMGNIILGSSRDTKQRLHKYWHYLFVISILTIFLSILALLNAYFRLMAVSPYSVNRSDVSSALVLSGYLGMFLSLAFSPVPDYILVPLYGYLSSIGFFNPYSTFLVCLLGALIPIEFICGRLAARLVFLKVLSFLHISVDKLQVADKWIIDHGKFSIFISTFIPFFYSVVSLAAGTLKMSLAEFMWSSTAGFALRFAFLEGVGFFSIYIFTASFDYSQRTLFFVLLILSSVYAVVHIVRVLVQRSRRHMRAIVLTIKREWARKERGFSWGFKFSDRVTW